eukprot:CAMPEP_0170619524 /NCGR_PEP_ID=MMETSP0224-20130122/27563_1 /TAXON_ID=285029 /ORGANISM="Togula jolla, Strain CCCM 725" /LENGTH=255 /DNA_ID=CAMNT_0010945621 /DNA_START=248 /DNA_END=1015 /DNA_ORIENTATION=-
MRPQFAIAGSHASKGSRLASRRSTRTCRAGVASDFTGVAWHETIQQWQAHVPDPVSGKPISLGLFGSQRDAAQAFDCASIVLKGDSASTNFPSDTYTKDDLFRAERILKDFWRPRPSSQYRGVYRTRGSSKWRAEVELHGVKQFIDNFDDELEAANAADNAVRSTGVERVLQLQTLNFVRDEDHFKENTWEEEVIPRGASSRFLGVSFHQPSAMYLARLGRKHVGLYPTELEAAKAFDEASHAVGGVTNFRIPSK